MGDETHDGVPRRLRAARWVAVCLALATVSACAARVEAPDPLESAAAGPLPGGVAVSVYQSRSDVVSRSLQIRVENLSTADLTVSGAEFSSAQFADPAVWQKDSTVVKAGRTVDLPVSLAESVCVEPGTVPAVTLEWRVDGSITTSEVTPTDERGRLGELSAEACFGEAVAAVASFSADTPPRTVSIDGELVAELDVTATPGASGGGGVLAVDSVGGTTLFTMLDRATSEQTTSLPLGIEIPGTEPVVITLSLVPTRCDPHAVAEDKQGTIFPFSIVARSADGGAESGTVFVATPSAVKESLIAFVGAACAASGGS